MTLPRLTEWKRLAQSHQTRLDQFPDSQSSVYSPSLLLWVGTYCTTALLNHPDSNPENDKFSLQQSDSAQGSSFTKCPIKMQSTPTGGEKKEGGGGPEGLEKFLLTKDIAHTHIPVCLKLNTENVCCKANYHL